MIPDQLSIGDTVKDSPVGPGQITEFTERGYPRVNGVGVAWLERTDGAAYDPHGHRGGTRPAPEPTSPEQRREAIRPTPEGRFIATVNGLHGTHEEDVSAQIGRAIEHAADIRAEQLIAQRTTQSQWDMRKAIAECISALEPFIEE